MADRQSRTALHPRSWGLGLVLCGLALQAALGAGAQVRRELRLWWPQPAYLGSRQAEQEADRFVSFVAERAPRGETVLYVTPGTGAQEMWTYYWLSYELYPSAVWWVTPVPRASPVDWWISAPLDGPALAALARDRGARYLVADGAGALGAPADSSAQYRPGRVVLELGERQQP